MTLPVFSLWCIVTIWGGFYVSKFYCEDKLLLTPLIKKGLISQAKDLAFVSGIQTLIFTKSYSGYLTVSEEFHSHMFFWFFLSQTDPDNDPVILWLQGAPSKSSLIGLLSENGPFFAMDNHLIKRNTSFAKSNSVLYLDPIGAGFSHTDNIAYDYHATIHQIAEDLYLALVQLFTLFPNVAGNKFYIAGQSYGGKYAISLANLIDIKNSKTKTRINLAGIMLGGALIDPVHQFRYNEYMYELGLVNSQGEKNLLGYYRKLLQNINDQEWIRAYDTYYVQMVDENSYFRKVTGYDELGNLLETAPSYAAEYRVRRYLNRPEIQKVLHTGEQLFLPCDPYVDYRAEMMQSASHLLQSLIDKYKVLVYVGQLDMNVLYRTTVDYLMKLKFKGSEGYENADREHWYIRRDLVGYVTRVGNLTEVLVKKAGPSVPRDQLEVAVELFNWFIGNASFQTQMQVHSKSNIVL